jgi:hypothetical protein
MTSSIRTVKSPVFVPLFPVGSGPFATTWPTNNSFADPIAMETFGNGGEQVTFPDTD